VYKKYAKTKRDVVTVYKKYGKTKRDLVTVYKIYGKTKRGHLFGVTLLLGPSLTLRLLYMLAYCYVLHF
jgi:hypothetical protein